MTARLTLLALTLTILLILSQRLSFSLSPAPLLAIPPPPLSLLLLSSLAHRCSSPLCTWWPKSGNSSTRAFLSNRLRN